LVIQGLFPLLLPKKNPVKEIDRRPHGTKPAAEKVSQDDDEEKHSERGEHPQDELFLGKEGDDPDKRRQTEIEIHRDFDFQRKGRLENQIEKE
jgi:hypothetical protein